MTDSRPLLRIGAVLLLICVSVLPVFAGAASRAGAVPDTTWGTTDRVRINVTSAFAHSTYLPDVARHGPFPNCRFGIGQGGAAGYDVAPLNMGWHLDWRATLTPTHPNQAEYLQMIRLEPALGANGYAFTPTITDVYAIMDANLGATWLIGNEPDSPYQDNLTPEVYARAYHDLYALLKSHDPSVKIGAGGLVQPTPLRFEYLDGVWTAYLNAYGQPLPADLWNVHSYILREITPDDPEAQPNGPLEVWGAYVPPGTTATRGVLYNTSDQDNLAIFRTRLVDFRAWMRDHGQRDKPLLITEYGILFPEDYSDEKGALFSQTRAAAFMEASFDMLLELRDDVIGNPLDDDRLVQRWAWYSLSDMTFGGALFDPSSKQRRLLGDVYAAYTGQLAPAVDLAAPYAYAVPPAFVWTGVPVTVTLEAMISNQGNYSVTRPVTVTFWDAAPGTGSVIGSPQVVTVGLVGCGGYAVARVEWPVLTEGVHTFYVETDSSHSIDESNEDNNVAAGQVFVVAQRHFLPVALVSQ